MKRLKSFILLFFLVVVFSSCSAEKHGKIELLDIKTAKGIDEMYRPVEVTNVFPKGTSRVFCWFSWRNAVKGISHIDESKLRDFLRLASAGRTAQLEINSFGVIRSGKRRRKIERGLIEKRAVSITCAGGSNCNGSTAWTADAAIGAF